MTGPAPPLGLSRVPLPTLEHLATAVERGRVECPLTEAELRDAGLRDLAPEVLKVLQDLEKAAVLATLRVAIAERVHRPPPKLDLVWTGPETRVSTARSTRLVVEELFASAKTSVIVGGYAFDRPAILAPLHEAMRDRGVGVTMFVDIDGTTTKPEEADAFATAFIDKWFRKVWTFGLPKPDIYYDPRTAVAGTVPGYDWATLHAKCVVVDDERCLITSANFTDRGQNRNIEAGVLIEDPTFAQELAGHWRQLVAEGMVRRYLG